MAFSVQMVINFISVYKVNGISDSDNDLLRCYQHRTHIANSVVILRLYLSSERPEHS